MAFSIQVYIPPSWTDIDGLDFADVPQTELQSTGIQLRAVEDVGCVSPVYLHEFPIDVYDTKSSSVMDAAAISAAIALYGIVYGGTRYTTESAWTAAVIAGEAPAVLTYSNPKFNFTRGLLLPPSQLDQFVPGGIPVKDGATTMTAAQIASALSGDGLIYNSVTYTDETTWKNAVIANETDLDDYDNTTGEFIELTASAPIEVAVSLATGGSISILFVVDDHTAPDQRDTDIAALFTARGDTVTYVSDQSVVAGDATGHDVILISADASNTNAHSVFVSTAVPLFAMSTESADGHNMTSGSANTGFTQNINIDDNSHAITTGLSTGVLQVLTTNTGLLVSTSHGSGVALASEDGNNTNKAIIAWDTGVAMATGTAPARRAICFIDGQAGKRLNTDGENLVIATVDWLAA